MKNIYPIVLLLISTYTHAQIVNIPDANFKYTLVNTLCANLEGTGPFNTDVDTNDDGEIQVSEAEAVIWLNLDKVNSPNSEKISSLEGIQSFVNIEWLDFDYNLISSLNLNNNSNLTRLYCRYNLLTNLDISQNTILEELFCSNNPLVNLDLLLNSSLELLICHNAQLTQLDVTQNQNLKRIDCPNNQLTNLDITNNTNLEQLGIGYNELTSLNVTQNINLTELIFNNNQLTSIDVSQNLMLEKLSFGYNQISSLDISQNSVLADLAFGFNLISEIDLSHNPLIWYLYCEENQLSSLDVSQNPNLVYLSCNANQLVNLNIKNGNNSEMIRMKAIDNIDLTCIQVDDETATYPVCMGNSGWCKDAIAIYSEDCSLGIHNVKDIEEITLYPNPVRTIMNLNNSANVNINAMQIFNINGDLVLKVENSFEKVDLTKLNSGIFLVKVKTDKRTFVKKILVN